MFFDGVEVKMINRNRTYDSSPRTMLLDPFTLDGNYFEGRFSLRLRLQKRFGSSDHWPINPSFEVLQHLTRDSRCTWIGTNINDHSTAVFSFEKKVG